jgi:hypothetical protein
MKNRQDIVSYAGAFLALAAFSANPAKANPVPVYGDIDFVGSTTLNTSKITTATVIKTVSAHVTDSSLDDGDYASVPTAEPVTVFAPIDYQALTTAPLSAVTPVWSFTVGTETYSFDITGPVDVVYKSANSLDLAGMGIASITGYESNAAASWEINIGTSGGKLTFGFSTSAVRVPDRGTTALLIGIGLAAIGVGVLARRKPAKG